ncbi:uncharacterized protein EV154DRAFT_571234 [Mucor mucedo]|uniref:uncharacterized protein n=1 Tax=Mucor mucedo TaxID=29922 RepID=UPI00221EA41B|nr:uncharacterized protein EV154DRAFT_571234 [Mucor mucedo]KAI7869274.1 hypothetical protein EV154DRAFT_571234 [Mucor mucedo]
MDDYWLTTQRQTNEVSILKRKGETSAAKASQPKKSTKDKKLSSSVDKEGIVDFSNTGPSGQSHVIVWNDSQGVEVLSASYELKDEFKKAILKTFKNSDHINIQYRKTLDYQMNASSEDLFFFKILSHLIEAYQINSHIFNIEEQRHLSEKNFDHKIYARLLELLFSDRIDIKIRSGETKMDNFKLDYRIGFYHKSSFIDVSNIDVSKAATVTKVKDHHDHFKLIRSNGVDLGIKFSQTEKSLGCIHAKATKNMDAVHQCGEIYFEETLKTTVFDFERTHFGREYVTSCGGDIIESAESGDILKEHTKIGSKVLHLVSDLGQVVHYLNREVCNFEFVAYVNIIVDDGYVSPTGWLAIKKDLQIFLFFISGRDTNQVNTTVGRVGVPATFKSSTSKDLNSVLENLEEICEGTDAVELRVDLLQKPDLNMSMNISLA